MKKYEFQIKESLDGKILSEENVTVCAENLKIALFKVLDWCYGFPIKDEEC